MSFLQKSDRSGDSLSNSNSPPRKTFTTGFKSVGRQTSATWANRFTKDINDLTYNINFSQIKGKDEMVGHYNHFRLKKRLTGGGRSSHQKKKINKTDLRLEMMGMNKIQNPEKHHIPQPEQYSTINTHGLCKFEFDKTIVGKLKNKKNHHLDFNNQTGKDYLLEQVNNQEQLEPCIKTKLYKTLNVFNLNPGHYKINKCHDFQSYSPRRVFEPREQLDKFYNVQQVHRKTKTKTIKQTARISTVRHQSIQKLGTNLSYDDHRGKSFIMRNPKSHEIAKSPRKIELGRQVISPSRGCYR